MKERSASAVERMALAQAHHFAMRCARDLARTFRSTGTSGAVMSSMRNQLDAKLYGVGRLRCTDQGQRERRRRMLLVMLWNEISPQLHRELYGPVLATHLQREMSATTLARWLDVVCTKDASMLLSERVHEMKKEAAEANKFYRSNEKHTRRRILRVEKNMKANPY
jgi:hypothetical protein